MVSHIVQALYSIRTAHSTSKHAEALQLEQRLDKWALELPEYLRYEPTLRKLPVPPPHVLTLMMKYWTTVILLHRPLYVFPCNACFDTPSNLASSIHLKQK